MELWKRIESMRASLLRYGLSILVAVVAVGIRMLYPVLAGTSFLLALFAVLISTWYGGIGPGLVTSLLTAVGILYFVMPFISNFENLR